MGIQTRHQIVESGAVDLTFDFQKNNNNQALLAVQIRLSAVPSTTEDLTVTLKSAIGTDYDIPLLVDDPSEAPGTNAYLFIPPESPLPLGEGDQIQVEYTNTDSATVTVVVKSDDAYY